MFLSDRPQVMPQVSDLSWKSASFKYDAHFGLKRVESISTIYKRIVAKFGFWYEANLSELINFYFPWNHQKTFGSLDDIREIHLNSLNIRKEIWRQSLTYSLLDPNRCKLL